MKGLANKLVGDVRAIEIARVDVIDPARNRLAQHREGGIVILRRPKYARSGKPHRAVAHSVHGAVAQGEDASGGDAGHVSSSEGMRSRLPLGSGKSSKFFESQDAH